MPPTRKRGKSTSQPPSGSTRSVKPSREGGNNGLCLEHHSPSSFRALTFLAGSTILGQPEPSTRGACSFCKRRKAKCDFVPEANACRACIAKGLEANCAAPWASSGMCSTSHGRHNPPTEDLQSLPENLDSREPGCPDSPSSIRRGRRLTRASQSDIEPVKSKKWSRSKSDRPPSGERVVKRILEDNTHRKKG